MKWVIAYDTHGDMIDKSVESDFFQFVDDFQPDLRIHGGDAFDFRPIRSGVDQNEKMESMKVDVEAGLEFMNRLKPDVWLMGNHDDRLHRTMEHAADGIARQHAHDIWDGICKALPNTQTLPYGAGNDSIYHIGDLSVLHGSQTGMYVSKQVAEHAASSAIMGHVHSSAMFPLANAKGHVGYTSGCMCNLKMQYARQWRSALKWNHGWAYGYEDAGQASVFLAIKRHNRWNYMQGDRRGG